ncbi:MAG: glutamate--tRNA ligase [bacterium]|nr:glutamate--tRNA ligase [bacterium]
MKIITRFPPSPTGKLQLGNARTALFNYLFAKKNGGSFYFRLEDTDRERSQKEFETDMTESLAWLGLTHDPVEAVGTAHGAGPVADKLYGASNPVWRQSERGEIYRAQLKKLVDAGAAYISKETELPPETTNEFHSPRRSVGQKRDEVVRFKNPNKVITFNDLIRGKITFNTAELGDFVIAKSMEEPIYHLAVVIDDAEMGITHVIRGEDGISNTPRQILLQEALGFARPEYAHLPLILAPDRTKLSKRHGAIPVSEYRARGFIPEAVTNYLALLGWNPGTEQEIFSLNELIQVFDLSKVQKGGAVFSEEKMRSVNKEYLKKGGVAALKPHIPESLLSGKSSAQIDTIAETLLDRISVFSDIQKDIDAGELDYLVKELEYPKELLRWKKAEESPKAHLEKVLSIFEGISEGAFTKSGIKEAILPYAESKGKGNVLWPMRVALSGKEQSPDPFTLAAMVGKEATLSRLRHALGMLE